MNKKLMRLICYAMFPLMLAGCTDAAGSVSHSDNKATAVDTTASDTEPVTTASETTKAPETTAAPVASDGKIPDKYTGNITTTGEWKWSSALNSPMELYPETLWISGAVSASVKYEPHITAVGDVRISAYILGWDESQDQNVEYVVHTADGDEKIYVNTAEYKKDKSAWLELGTFKFDGSGSEYVQINRISSTGNTRASTIRFEIMNEASSGSVWQYVYLGPMKDYSPLTTGMLELNKFTDLADCENQYDIEYLASLDIIGGEGIFDPDAPISAADFADWLSKASGTTRTLTGTTVTSDAAAELLHDAATVSGKNLEWMEEYSDAADFLVKSGMVKQVPATESLTRSEAAAMIKGYYHVITTAGVSADDWTLTFHDEFEGDKLNTDVWVSQNGDSGHILSTRWASNAEVKDGLLRLLTKKETVKGYEKEWTTGNVWVNKNVFQQKYGYWEASIKINAATGLNNAFWMIDGQSEIDIVEAHYKNSVKTNFHVISSSERKQYSEAYNSSYDLSQDFHTYAVHWTETELVYYFDGKEIARKVNYNAHRELFPYLSTAVLNWAGRITDEADGQAMEVEWVRIYKEKTE